MLTPEDPGLTLCPNIGEEVDNKLHQAAVAAIIYVTCGTSRFSVSIYESVWLKPWNGSLESYQTYLEIHQRNS